MDLYEALCERRAIAPLTDANPTMTIDEAYKISQRFLACRLAAGERLVGKKIGVTSKPVQNALNVHQPDFGFLTDAMAYEDGATLPISTKLIQPRAEGELAFVLSHDLRGPGVTEADVIGATAYVSPCFEIVDSRIKDWKIRIQDTIADNASSGLFVLGRQRLLPRAVDFITCGIAVWKNGSLVSTGAGAAAMGSPVACVAWLANTLGRYGIHLNAGEIILSGSLVPLEPVVAGDAMHLQIGGVGTASVKFA